jgi:3D (Asp-Asp-Asp) domain-containing protein
MRRSSILGLLLLLLTCTPGFAARYHVTAIATGYCKGACRRCGTTGHPHAEKLAHRLHVGRRIIAVDPRIIPIGAKVFVHGIPGPYWALDTGGKVKGHRIDIPCSSHAAARRFGKRRVRLTVIPPARRSRPTIARGNRLNRFNRDIDRLCRTESLERAHA